MKRLLLFSAALAMIATACSENNTTPSDTASYVSTKVGAYVIHQNSYSNSEEGTVQESDDSTVVTGTATISDDKGVSKTGIIHVVFIDGAAADTIVLAQSGTKVYMLFDLALEAGDVVDPVALGTRWVQVADASASSSWTGLEETITGIDFDYNGLTLPANVAFKLTGSKTADTTMSIGGSNVKAVKYAIAYSINITIQAPPPIGNIVLPIALNSSIYLGENIGMVRQAQDPQQVSIPAVGQEFEIDGYNSVAIRYGGN